MTKVYLEAELRNFATTANGVRWEAVIFSSEYNRNNAFFDIYKLKKWQNKLEKVLLNNNHDGKYFANSTDKITSLEVKTDDAGITEVYAVVESTNPEKIENPQSVTGFSIELSVKNSDVIANENGEYYIDFEWVGLAYLTGVLAGSGDSRILLTKTFAEQQTKEPIMTENQINEKLQQFKAELKAELIEELKNQPAPEAETHEEATLEEDPDLVKTEMQLNKNAEHQAKMAVFRTDEELVEQATTKTTEAKDKPPRWYKTNN